MALPARFQNSKFVQSLAKRDANKSKKITALSRQLNDGRTIVLGRGLKGTLIGAGLGFVDGYMDPIELGENEMEPSAAVALGSTVLAVATGSKMAGEVAVAAATIAGYKQGQKRGRSFKASRAANAAAA